MNRATTALTVCLLWLSPSLARAEVHKVITTSRVRFGELVPDAPTEVQDLDLGPAPPAGSSRLFSANELASAARRAGTNVAVSDSVRVVRATKRWSQLELRELVKSKLQSTLPAHARLLHVDVPQFLVSSTTAELSRVTLGQLPSRQGTVHTSAVADLTSDGRIEHRLVISVALDLGIPPKPIELPQGTLLTLVIRLGTTQVSTSATTLQPTTVGSIALVRVIKTRKTLHGKILTATMAEVVAP